MRRSPLPLMFSVLALGLLLLREAGQQPLAGTEETFVNWLAANSNGAHETAPLMLVEINENGLEDYPWPWTPLNYAEFLDAALQFKARAAAIEPVLAWDEKRMPAEQAQQLPQYEKFLHDRILQMPKLELGAQLGFPDDPDVLPPLQPTQILHNVKGPVDEVPEYTAIESEPAEEMRLSTALGFANVPSNEPTAQHCPLVFRYRGQIVPSFVLQALMLWYGVVPDEVEVRLGSEVRLDARLAVPVNAAGEMLVDWKQPYDHAGFDDLELAVEQIEHNHAPVIDTKKLNDRLLLLARTDDKARMLITPNGGRASSGELFAAALATAEMNAFAKPAGYIGDAVVLLLGLLMASLVMRRRKLWVAVAAVGFGAGYLLVCLAIFEGMRVALPLTPMLGVAGFVCVYRLLGE